MAERCDREYDLVQCVACGEIFRFRDDGSVDCMPDGYFVRSGWVCDECCSCPECGASRVDFKPRCDHQVREREGVGWKVVAPKIVNVYRVHRRYGGPEEGGWWDDDYDCRQSIPVESRAGGERLRAQLARDRYSNEGARPLDSVLSDGVWEILIEDEVAESRTEGRPRYE